MSGCRGGTFRLVLSFSAVHPDRTIVAKVAFIFSLFWFYMGLNIKLLCNFSKLALIELTSKLSKKVHQFLDFILENTI